MKIVRFVFISILAMNIGCIPLAIHYGQSKKIQRDFLYEFYTLNHERERAGLPPLDLCTEKYYFDEGWAKDDPECKARIERFEAGDKTAIGTQELETVEEQKGKQEDTN